MNHREDDKGVFFPTSKEDPQDFSGRKDDFADKDSTPVSWLIGRCRSEDEPRELGLRVHEVVAVPGVNACSSVRADNFIVRDFRVARGGADSVGV